MKALLLTALGLVLVTGTSFAQVTANAAASVGLEVVAGIGITNGADINFGTVAPGQGTITLANSGAVTATAGPAGTGAVGQFAVSGYPGGTFSISAPASASLTGNGTAITFTPTIYGGATNDAGSATSGATSGTLDGTGNYYLFVGGSLDVPVGQATGTYTGSVTVTVAYTAI